MPQIANQDYNVVKPAYADYVKVDAQALGMLAGYFDRGTIFDCVINNAVGGDENDFERIISIEETLRLIYFFSASDGEVGHISFPYNSTQYDGLAAVQVAVEATGSLPELIDWEETGYLGEDINGKYICVGNKLVSVEYGEDYKITKLTVTNEDPEEGDDFVNISSDDLQKLIGVELSH